MSSSIKDFSGLKSLRKDLKAQEEARVAAETERVRREKETQRDANLFRRSVGDVAPLPSKNKVAPSTPHPEPIPRPPSADEQAVLQDSLSDAFMAESLLDSDGSSSFTRNGIGPDVLRKLRRGHWVIQSQLDLHGKRSDEAREALSEFLHKTEQRGLRCVLVIHGKGLSSISKEPVLKNKVRNWLAQKNEVMAFCPARAADGGSGALVVLLRR